MLLASYHDRHRTRGLLNVRVEEPHLIVIPLLQSTLLADVIPSRDIFEVGDGTIKGGVAGDSLVGAPHTLDVELPRGRRF